ncbi:MAG: biotin/lipoyl-containing protein [Pyrinomonadaceae bacterium]|nr:biotin/lipoyl-containing protein [Pyrinomonadaceae bacterium]
MKLKAEIKKESLDVEIRMDGDRVTAVVGDITYDLEVTEPENGVYLFKNGGKISEASVTPGTAGSYTVKVRGKATDVKLIDPKRLRGSGSNNAHADGVVVIKTAMPGKVVRILKNAGDEVAKGEGVIVVEAMKMQNEMRSPKDGVVKEMRVAEGQTVASGEVLTVIE